MDTPVRAATTAGRYHPPYYAVVGWPLRLSPDWTGVLLARLLSAGLSAALLKPEGLPRVPTQRAQAPPAPADPAGVPALPGSPA